MLARSDQTPVLHTWQSDLNYAIEAGVAPTIPIGLSDSALAALPSLTLLRDLASQRTDMTVPTILAGGGSSAWLAALFLTAELPEGAAIGGEAGENSMRTERVSPPPIVIYSGADAPVHMASAGILPRAPRGLLPVTDWGLPPGVRDSVAPTLQPAAPIAWENLPFRMLDDKRSATGLPAASLWMGWLAGILTFIMILGALIA